MVDFCTLRQASLACLALQPREPQIRSASFKRVPLGATQSNLYGKATQEMFEQLSERFQGAFRSLTGRGRLSEANIEEAFRFLAHNYSAGDRVFVFGFSRGAAQARALTHFLDWLGGVPAKGDAYFGPLFFLHWVKTRGHGRPEDVRTAGGADDDIGL